MALKSIIKKGIMWYSSVLHRNNKSKILYYHDIYETVNYKALDSDIYMGTHIDVFKKHVNIIKNEGYEIVTRINRQEGQVAIMLDDGFRGIWECRNYFYENDIYPTIFLPIEYIGDKEKGMLTKDEILELQKHGFCFECHGWSHKPLTYCCDEELIHELQDSKKHLGSFLSKEINGICLPLGFYSHHLIEKIREYGYNDIYSSLPGNYNDNPDGMLTRNLCQNSSPEELKLILRGGNEILRNHYQKLQEKPCDRY